MRNFPRPLTGLQSPLGWARFDPSSEAWFAAMATQLPSHAKSYVDSLFVRPLKSAGVLSAFTALGLGCLQTQAQCLVDAVNPSRSATVAPGFTSTFTAFRNFTGSGSASGSQDAYIDLGVKVPAQDAASIGVFLVDNVAGAAVPIGARGTNDFYLVPRNASNQCQVRSNNVTTNTLATGVTDGSGLMALVRSGPTVTKAYRNGAAIGSPSATASIGVPTGNVRLIQLTSIAASTQQFAGWFVGPDFDDTEMAAISSAFNSVIPALRSI